MIYQPPFLLVNLLFCVQHIYADKPFVLLDILYENVRNLQSIHLGRHIRCRHVYIHNLHSFSLTLGELS